jgi:hypothetical protein
MISYTPYFRNVDDCGIVKSGYTPHKAPRKVGVDFPASHRWATLDGAQHALIARIDKEIKRLHFKRGLIERLRPEHIPVLGVPINWKKPA